MNQKRRKLMNDYAPCRRNSENMPFVECEFYQWLIEVNPENRLIALRGYKDMCRLRANRWGAVPVFPKAQTHHSILSTILDFYEYNYFKRPHNKGE